MNDKSISLLCDAVVLIANVGIATVLALVVSAFILWMYIRCNSELVEGKIDRKMSDVHFDIRSLFDRCRNLQHAMPDRGLYDRVADLKDRFNKFTVNVDKTIIDRINNNAGDIVSLRGVNNSLMLRLAELEKKHASLEDVRPRRKQGGGSRRRVKG